MRLRGLAPIVLSSATFVVSLTGAGRASAADVPPETVEVDPGGNGAPAATTATDPALSPPVIEQAPLPESSPPKPWRFTGTIGVLALPRPLSLELIARYRRKDDPRWDLFAVGLGIDYLPSGFAKFTEKTALSWLTVGADARWFPWRMIFVGARVGYQYVRVDSEKFGSEVDYTSSSFLLAPKAGALYTFNNGLTLGGELGVGIPIAASSAIDSDGTTDSNARKVVKTFGWFAIPFVSLRVGYTF